MNEQVVAADLADIEAELAGLNQEERQRNEKVDRARSLERAISTVRDTEAELRREVVQLAKFDAALAILKKIDKALDAMPDVPGGRPTRSLDGMTAGVEIVPSAAEYIGGAVDASKTLIEQRREKTQKAIGRYEEALASAQAQVKQLRTPLLERILR